MSSFQLTAPGSNNSVLRSVPLISRGDVVSKLVPCTGNKLIVCGGAGGGLSFFTKYLILKSYRDASILFIDSTCSFSRRAENLSTEWNEKIMAFNEVGYKDVFSEPLTIPGITYVDLLTDFHTGTSEEDDIIFTNYLINVVEYIAQLPPTKTTRVLIVERLWLGILSKIPLWESLTNLLRVSQKMNLEIWLLAPIDLYGEIDDNDCLQRFIKLQATIPNVFLLDHRKLIHDHRMQTVWQLTPTEGALFASVNRDLSSTLLPYREVFAKLDATTRSQVYGIKAELEEIAIIG